MTKKVEIKNADVEFIMGEDYESEFNLCMNGLRCSSCKQQVQDKIENYKIFLSEAGNIIFEVPCRQCGKTFTRSIKTSKHKDSYEKAIHILEVKMKLLKEAKKGK